MTAAWSFEISVISEEAVPAAERPKNVAPGASPGYLNPQTLSPEGAKDSAATLSPLPGLGSTPTRSSGPRPELRSYAAPRQKTPGLYGHRSIGQMTEQKCPSSNRRS